MKVYTSKEILKMEDLYELQDFCSIGLEFHYQLTEGEFLWWRDWMKDRYSIGDWIDKRLNGDLVLTFDDCVELGQALHEDGTHPLAPMLAHDSALQRIFFWCASEPETEPEP